MTPGPEPMGERLLSSRGTRRIEQIFAVIVVAEDGTEGICRRDTPIGTQPWMTDDPALGPRLLALAQQSYPARDGEQLHLVEFRRVMKWKEEMRG